MSVPDPAGETSLGRSLRSRYRVEGEIGRGAFGVVLRARDRIAGEPVALKVFAPRAGASRESLARFRRELHAARRVTHPAVVRIHDLIEVDGDLALAMELVEGETLERHLARAGKLDAGSLASLALDLAGGLAAAHLAGVVHRDLKPANVILRRGSGRAVITDFGTSRLTGALDPARSEAFRVEPAARLTSEGQVLGTPLYMAPEQLEGKADVGPAADVYALGALVFEAATGSPPHPATSVGELLRARRASPVPPLARLRPDLPPGLTSVIDRSLAAGPEARFASAVEVRDALARAGGVSRRRRRLQLAGVALVCVLAPGAVAFRVERGLLPRHGRRLVVQIENLGGDGDAWIAPALERMAARRLAARAGRYRVVENRADANVLATLSYRREAGAVTLTAALAPASGRSHPVGEAREPSVSEALDRLVPALRREMEAGQEERAPDPAEAAAMRGIGARSLAAFQHYQACLAQHFALIYNDTRRDAECLEEALRLQPGWAHAYALEAWAWNWHSREARDTLARARREVVPGRDPGGDGLLAIHEALLSRDLMRLEPLAEAVLREAPDDLFATWQLGQAKATGSPDEFIAVNRRLHELRPDLFGVELAVGLHAAGFDDEATAFERSWVERAPESASAFVARAEDEVFRGQPAAAERTVRRALLVHGGRPELLMLLTDVLLSAGRPVPAHALAERLQAHGGVFRVRGRIRLGYAALLAGRFDDAWGWLSAPGIAADDSLGVLERVAALESLLVTATLLGRMPDALAAAVELEHLLASFVNPTYQSEASFERRLLGRSGGPCPDPGAGPEGLPEGEGRRTRREIRRLAAAAGCASCRDVLRDGLGVQERRARSLYAFAACAESEGELHLAREVFVRVLRSTRPTALLGSPCHAVLSRYHLGRVLERLGEREAARAHYSDFLALWGQADRPLPEVADARAALARLGGMTER